MYIANIVQDHTVYTNSNNIICIFFIYRCSRGQCKCSEGPQRDLCLPPEVLRLYELVDVADCRSHSLSFEPTGSGQRGMCIGQRTKDVRSFPGACVHIVRFVK